MSIPASIQSLIDRGYTFQTSRYLTAGWRTFIQNPLPFIGFTGLFFSAQLLLSLIPVFGMLGLMILMPAMDAGFFIGLYYQRTQKPFSFSVFFKGFSAVAPLMAQYILSNLAYGILLMPLFISLFSNIDLFALLQNEELDTEALLNMESFDPWTLIWILPLIYLAVAWRWAPLFILFFQMTPWSAMESSRQLISRQWGNQFLFALALAILYASGILFFLAGVLLTYPLMKSMDYVAFASVTGMESQPSEEEDDSSRHLIE